MLNNGPKPLNLAQKAIMLHTVGVQVVMTVSILVAWLGA